MDSSGQPAPARDPDETPNALDLLGDHIQNSITGCCNKCGRPWFNGTCDAPEVMWALQVLRKGRCRPDYRMNGGNALKDAYLFA